MSDDNETVPRPRARVRPRLTIVAGTETQTVDLPSGGSLTVGRSSTADITIDDASLSRVHARIELGQRVLVRDLGSSNGSWAGGRKVEPEMAVEVADGEMIELGNVIVMVHRDHGSPSTEDSPPASMSADQASAMDRVNDAAARAAKHRLSVLVLGETGVGKGVLARSIHDASPRAAEPFVVVDCASLAPDVIESELFGHERGAFTGAEVAKPGLLEVAHGGTAFLDEIGELRLPLQSKLLRVIEDGRVRRVGDVHDREIDVRFVAATNCDLEAEAVAGKFRKDLLYRLNAVTIHIPPLRQRTEEIIPLAVGFLAEVAEADPPTLSLEAKRWLLTHQWPGNVRELRNAMERAFASSDGPQIEVESLVQPTRHGAPPSSPEDLSERARIVEALDQCAGNQTRAAALLGISRRTLIHRLDVLGLPRPRKGRR